jgi:integrase
LIEDAVQLYLEHHAADLKNFAGVRAELAHIHWAYKGRYLDELGDVARNYAADMRGQLSPASIKNKLSYLRAACRYAQEFHGKGQGLALKVAMPAVKNERQVYATRKQMLDIAKAAENREIRALIRLGFYTGMRIGEMMSIGHTSDWQAGTVFLRKTKNGEARTVALHSKVWVLQKYFPLPYKKRWMQRLWERARQAAGYPHLHFHDLRHSTASAMANEGVDLYAIGQVLGHKDLRSTQRYAHLLLQTKAAAVRKIK